MTQPPGSLGGSRSRRFFLGLTSLLLSALCVVVYLREVRTRQEAVEFLRGAGEPLLLQESQRQAGAGDLSLALAVDAALTDPTRLGDPTSRDQTAGRSRARTQRALAARDLMLRAVETRPGSAYHRLLLGRATYEASAGDEDPGRSRPWAMPLHLAALGAPGLDVAWTELALAHLRKWEELTPAERDRGMKAIRRAALSSEFVATGFALAVSALGREKAAGLLSDDSRLLESGAEELIRRQDLSGAATLLARRDRAQRNECAVERIRIERLAAAKDADGMRAACWRWASAQCGGDLSDRADQAAAARVLELWPERPSGDWYTDPRARIVRLFLNGPELSVSGHILVKTIDRLAGVPEPARAEVMLLAGDLRAAEEVGGSPESLGSLEWTPYFVALARYHLRHGRADEANDALERVGAGFREECEMLLVRRQLARAQGNRFEVAALNARLGSLADGLQPRQTRGEARFSVCVDPERSARTALVLRLAALRPAIVAYGWDGARPQTIHVQTDHVLRIPLGGLEGRQGLSLRFMAGGPVRVLETSLDHTG